MNKENIRNPKNDEPISVLPAAKYQESGGMDLYKSILKNQEEYIVRFNSKGEITYTNQAFCDITGISLQKLMGRNISTVFSSRLLPNLHETIKKIIASPRRLVLDEYTYLNNGTHRWIQWVGTPITDESKQIIEIQADGRDITNLKRHEETILVQRDLALLLNESDGSMACVEKLDDMLKSLSAFSLYTRYMYESSKESLVLQHNHFTENIAIKFPKRVVPDSALGGLLYTPGIEFYSSNSPELVGCSINLPSSIKSLAVLHIQFNDQPIASLILGSTEFSSPPDEVKDQLLSIFQQLENYLVRINLKSQILQQENDLFTLFKSLNQMLLIINEDGEIIDANRPLSEYAQDKNVKQAGLRIFDLHPVEDRKKLENALFKLVKDRQSCIQIPLINTDGQKTNAEINFSYCSWNGKERIVATYKDITQQIRFKEMENEQQKFAAALVEIASLLNSSLDLDIVLDHIIESIDKVIPTKACNVLLNEGINGRIIRQRGYEQIGTAEILSSRIIPLNKVKTFAKILKNKKELAIPDTQNSPEWKPRPESFWVHSFMGAPIVINDHVYGFLNCDSNISDAFTEKDAKKLRMVADQAAIAIENATVYSETKHRLKQIGLINELTQSMLESKQMGDIFLTLPQKIISVFDANSLLITKWDPEKRTASQIAAFGEGILPNALRTSKPGNLTITEHVLQQKSALVISTDQDYAPWKNVLGTVSSDRIFLMLPMINQDNLLGAILIGFKGSKQITPAEISIGEYAALQIAAIIYKSNAYENAKIQSAQFQHANDLIASLSYVATSILCAKGLEDILQTMGDGLEKMNIHSLLFFHEQNSSYLSLDYCSRNKELLEQLKGMDYPLKDKIRLPINEEDEFRNTLDHQQIVFIDDPLRLLFSVIPSRLGPFIGKFQDALALWSETKSLLMPLIVERKTIGLLCLYGKDLLEIDLKAGEIFNSQISVALENSKLLAEVKRLAVTDELTEINNRRGLFELGNREFVVSKRLNRPLTALMIDLDNFKEINDKYGHMVGDVTLREVAKRISSNIREIDIIGRYGGEEFVVLLTGDDIKSAFIVAERIRQAIGDQKFETEAGPIQVTVSIGINELDLMTTDLEKLIKCADRALYIAKHNGRNQVASLMN